ncbi:hypothetical protein PIROE2DRAFT_63704 [Piromyces sp. E2]|nr:hypothetical protein PIROE2DRAFT_63704 [Piromyces sp. E2]|eukprot:OUM59552.1 hypothetical protein PIROE2DRAFT_63704 [Piromyces sp. E2]
MQFKTKNIFLSVLSFTSTVLSAPINEEDIKASYIPVNVEKLIDNNVNASPIPVKADKNIFEGLVDNNKNNVNASPIPVKADKNIFEGLADNDKNNVNVLFNLI